MECLVEIIERLASSIFDNAIGVTYYDECLSNKTYMEERYHISIDVKQLTPFEYYAYCADMFNTSVESLKKSRENDNGIDYIKSLEEVIQDRNNKFPMTYIDFSRHYKKRCNEHLFFIYHLYFTIGAFEKS